MNTEPTFHPTRNPLDGRLHFGELKAMAESPQHYLHACSEVRKPWTEAIRVGLVADCLVFGQRDVAVYRGVASEDDGNALVAADVETAAKGGATKQRKTPRNGKAWDEFRAKAEAAGKVTCIESEYAKACGAAEALLFPKTDGAKHAFDILQRCTRRQDVMHWEKRGLQCASGIDKVRGGLDAYVLPHENGPRGCLADMKITADVEPEALMRHAARMKWHCQLAWYGDAIDANWLGKVDSFIDEFDRYNICVEAEAPHVVTVLEYGEDAMQAGDKAISLWMGRLISCEQSGSWEGYVARPILFELPEWAE